MKKAMGLLLMMAAPLCGSEVKILNPQKGRGEPTFAIIKENNSFCFKVYGKDCKLNDFCRYFKISKNISIIHFDNTIIEKLTAFKGITELRVTNSTIKACSDIFDIEVKNLQNLYIAKNKIYKTAAKIIEKIETNESIVICKNTLITDNNVVIEDANNTNN